MIASRPLFDRVAGGAARRSSRATPRVADADRRRVAAASRRAVVDADEREAGPRRALNFGHTAGHALEAVTKYRRFRHGEAVGYGMLVGGGARRRARRDARQRTATRWRR